MPLSLGIGTTVLDDVCCVKARGKYFKLFTVLCSVLLDLMSVSFYLLRNVFQYDNTWKILTSYPFARRFRCVRIFVA